MKRCFFKEKGGLILGKEFLKQCLKMVVGHVAYCTVRVIADPSGHDLALGKVPFPIDMSTAGVRAVVGHLPRGLHRRGR